MGYAHRHADVFPLGRDPDRVFRVREPELLGDPEIGLAAGAQVEFHVLDSSVISGVSSMLAVVSVELATHFAWVSLERDTGESECMRLIRNACSVVHLRRSWDPSSSTLISVEFTSSLL